MVNEGWTLSTIDALSVYVTEALALEVEPPSLEATRR
jgi:hypothetical protein